MHPQTRTLPRPRARLSASAMTAAVIFISAVVLRIIPWLTNYPLHRDEALYGYWARLIASGQDSLLLTPWIDKPPLVLYLLAADVRAFGASELALRGPGMLASLLLVLVTLGFARRAYGMPVALVAAGLLTLSPFAILFAPTAFTDPWLALWLIAAAWAALARRPLFAGLLLGLAVGSKQQGVLGVPLVFALLAVGRSRIANSKWQIANRNPAELSAMRDLLYAVLGFALIFAPVTYWDSLRWVNRPSFWDRSVATYGPLALAPLAEWPRRAAEWAAQLGYLFGLPALSSLMLLIAAAVGLQAILRLRIGQQDHPDKNSMTVMLNGSTRRSALRRTTSSASRSSTRLFAGTTPFHRLTRQPAQSDTRDLLMRRVDAVLALYVAGYLALHFAATFQPWDRYLLPILPWVCMLAARGLVLGWKQLSSVALRPTTEDAENAVEEKKRSASSAVKPSYTLLLVVPALLYAAWLGAAGRLPVGSDHGAYSGLDQAVATLRAQPIDAIIYDRWLGWHYDFYLFDAPQERHWWGSGWKLADDAAQTARTEPERAQWVVLPAWETSAVEELHLPLASRGLALAEVQRIYRPDNTRSFTVYRIAPLRAEVTP